MGVIENLIDRVDTFLIGGAMAYTFLAAMKVPVGKSRVEKDKVKYAAELVERMAARRSIHSPTPPTSASSMSSFRSEWMTSMTHWEPKHGGKEPSAIRRNWSHRPPANS
jgi:3-phosphoglycerate kinase